ncbi:ATP-binding protein [Pseudozobellia sp. WGM2]|uniref:sensor histidine kinase n=1 Tax=Pseudozobellia sp. WGM2 TaxID=2787625 RepID=UPI001AE04C9B|nr:GAF domain-containing sensor histidine kinase [Pseudozobellia sp. WGM2]
MIKPQIPLNERERILALKSFNVLDTLVEEEYDAITKIAAEICNTPMALVSLVDSDRQWFKSHYGIDATETPRDLAFCAHAINTPENILIVEDSHKDDRFKDNPLVTGGPLVQFYAGAPLNTQEGFSIGTLCVIDTKPRKNFSQKQKECLKALANQVMAQLELRRHILLQKLVNEELNRKNDQLKHFSYRLAHDMKTPLHGISSLVGFIKEDYLHLLKETEIPEWLDTIDDRVSYMEALINGIMTHTNILNNPIEFKTFQIVDEINKIEDKIDSTTHFNLKLNNFEGQLNHSLECISFIFSELIKNTLKFSNQSLPEIEIGISDENKHYEFSYIDNGPGITEQMHKKVFVMFETLKRTNVTDTGIGLATVKALVEKLGGVITLNNRADNQSGVDFRFTLAKEIYTTPLQMTQCVNLKAPHELK